MIVLPVPLNWKHAQQPQKCKISPLFFVSFTWLTHPLTPWGLFMQAESRSPYLGIYPPSVMIIYLRLLKEKVWFCKIPYFFSLRKARSWICLLWQKMCLPYDLKEFCVKSVCVYTSGKRDIPVERDTLPFCAFPYPLNLLWLCLPQNPCSEGSNTTAVMNHTEDRTERNTVHQKTNLVSPLVQ